MDKQQEYDESAAAQSLDLISSTVDLGNPTDKVIEAGVNSVSKAGIYLAESKRKKTVQQKAMEEAVLHGAASNPVKKNAKALFGKQVEKSTIRTSTSTAKLTTKELQKQATKKVTDYAKKKTTKMVMDEPAKKMIGIVTKKAVVATEKTAIVAGEAVNPIVAIAPAIAGKAINMGTEVASTQKRQMEAMRSFAKKQMQMEQAQEDTAVAVGKYAGGTAVRIGRLQWYIFKEYAKVWLAGWYLPIAALLSVCVMSFMIIILSIIALTFSMKTTDETVLPGLVDVVYYNQADPRWGDCMYGPKQTIQAGGCGPTTLAMVYTSLTGTEMNPLEMANWAHEHGYSAGTSGSSHTLMSTGAEQLGLTCVYQGKDLNTALSYIAEGDLVISLMRGPGAIYPKGSGHFVLIRGVTEEGKVLVADCAKAANNDKKWEFFEVDDNLKKSCDCLWVIEYKKPKEEQEK